MQPAQPTPLAELVKSLTGLHQAQHQALMDMKLEQEDRFRLLVQAQDEDRRAIRSLLGREETPVAAPSIAHVPLMKMGPHDDPEAFVDLFEKTAEACGWARSQWPVRLIPLLTGEAQVAVANFLAYEDLKRAILQRVGRNPEQHRQRFRSVELGDCGRPFVMAQQLWDACRKWLLAEPRDVEGGIDLVVLEQFIARLPRRTAEWVRCHRPTSLAQAIQLAEDHLAACPGVGEPRPNLSLYLPPSLPAPSLWMEVCGVSGMPVGKSTGHRQSALASITIDGGPLRENWYGPHRAIGAFGMRIPLCISPGGLCNAISGSSAPALHFGEERSRGTVSKFDAYPMPRVDELLDRLGAAHFYSTLDLTKGYWQIPLLPLSKEKTAFTTPFGLHQFVTLPFGLFGAPATFQRLMDKVLRPHSAYAAAYLDDIIIHSNDWQRHMEHLRAVLRAAGRRAHRPETGGGGMWRGGRGKAERFKGRAGSETSGESVGK